LYCCRWWCDEGIDDTDTAMSLWMKMTATTTASLKIATNISVADYETTKKRPGDWMAAMHHLLHRVMTASECLLLRRRRRRSTERAKPAMPMKSEKCEDEFDCTDFNGLPVRRCFDSDFNALLK
jgi:hypothetical protein